VGWGGAVAGLKAPPVWARSQCEPGHKSSLGAPKVGLIMPLTCGYAVRWGRFDLVDRCG